MRQFFQPIAAFVYYNCQAAAGHRMYGGNFHAPAGACATERALNSAHGSAKIILFHFSRGSMLK